MNHVPIVEYENVSKQEQMQAWSSNVHRRYRSLRSNNLNNVPLLSPKNILENFLEAKQKPIYPKRKFQGPLVCFTKWKFPFGGGEESVLDTMLYAQNCLQIPSIWISYSNAHNDDHVHFSIVNANELRGTIDDNVKKPMALVINVNGGFSERSLYCWLRLLQPCLVHHQGSLKEEAERICYLLKIPLLSGFHFWHGLVNLNPSFGNVRILQNSDKHGPNLLLEKKLQQKGAVYVASQFMKDVVAKIHSPQISNQLNILPPLSEFDLQNATTSSLLSKQYVTVINVHESKGGRIFKFLLENFPNVAFLGVRTDAFYSAFDQSLDVALQKCPLSKIIGRRDDVKEIYAMTSLLLQPSEVDETFCRVVVEACASGLNMLCSDYGNIPNLFLIDQLKKECIVETRFLNTSSKLEEYQVWKERLQSFLNLSNEGKIHLQTLALQNYRLLQNTLQPAKSFCDLVLKIVHENEKTKKNIGLLTPWCDQGLGVQNRNYARILTKLGFNVFVLSFMPYLRTKQQADPNEWILPNVKVQESVHVREEITREELIEFVCSNDISKVILAETCWDRVFSMISELKALNVVTYGVPNVEIVRKDEIEKHHVFDYLLMNNRSCEQVFLQHNFYPEKLFYVGYHLEQQNVLSPSKLVKAKKDICFLILGGLNACSRKHVHVAVECFLEAQVELLLHSSFKNFSRLRLIATSQKVEDLLAPIQARIDSKGLVGMTTCEKEKLLNGQQKKDLYESVQLITWHFSHEQIQKLYNECDIVIQISKHEGLGIGFYEAFSQIKPVVTIDIAPHNEIVSLNTGWVLPIEKEWMVPNSENNSACILSADITKKPFTSLKNFFKETAICNQSIFWKMYNEKCEAIVSTTKERQQDFYEKFSSVFSL